MYNLTLNSKYILSTIGGSVINSTCIVTGIISYDECISDGFDVRSIAFNEKVLGKDDDTYLKNNSYFKCREVSVDPVTLQIVLGDNYFVVWSDIIDATRTNYLEETYTFKFNIKVKPSSTGDTMPILNILSDVETYLRDKYNSVAEFIAISGDQAIEVDKMRTTLDECYKVLRGFQSFGTFIPTIEKLVSDELSLKIVDIQDNVDILSEKITTIAAGL